MRRALALGAPLIGINNRDLRDLSIDLADHRAAGAAGARTACWSSESGIAHARRRRAARAASVDGFLIGSALMRAPRPGAGGAGAGVRAGEAVRAQPAARTSRRRAAATLRRLRVRSRHARAHVSAEQAAPLAGAGAAARACCRSACSATRRSAMSPTSPTLLEPARGPAARRRGRRLRRRAAPRSCRATAKSGPRSASAAMRCARAAATACCSTMATAAPAAAFDWDAVSGHPELARAHSSPAASGRTTRARRRRSALMRSTSARRSMRAPGVKSPDKIARIVRRAAPACAQGASRMRLSGRFGRFGGAYVPEILVPALEQLEARVPRRAGRSRVHRRARRAARQLCRAADAADPLPQPAGQHLSQARGSAPRRRAQDQPGACPGAARQAHGQDAG